MRKTLKNLSLLLFVIVTTVLFNPMLIKTQAAESLPAISNIDDPSAGQQIGARSSFQVRGWALNASGVAKVEVYSDGSLVGNATLGYSRPDVKAAYPNYPNADKSEFRAVIGAMPSTPGTHTISIKVYGKDGSVSTNSQKYNIFQGAVSNIDNPSAGQSVGASSTYEVRGWALNSSGVSKVEVYSDGSLVGNATLGYDRPDVKAAYPNYPDADKSEFRALIGAMPSTTGTHTVSIKVYGKDGTVSSNSQSYKIFKGAVSNIESPSGQAIEASQPFEVRGWALNSSGVSKVEVYSDGSLVGNATLGYTRNDVKLAYPNYPEVDAPEFRAYVGAMPSTPGVHTISIKVYGRDGTISTNSKDYTIFKGSLSNIDTPSSGQTIEANKSLEVSGWALNKSGVSKVEVYSDGSLVGNATLGYSRPDVNSAYPGYPNGSTSGFKALIGAVPSTPGTHTISIKVYGKDGTVTSNSADYNIYNPNIGNVTPGSLNPSQSVVEFISKYEGFAPYAYADSDGRMTIGYGHVLKAGESYPNGITKEQAKALLLAEIKGKYCSASLDPFLKNNNIKLTQFQYDSLVSFTYNLGEYMWTKSTSSFYLKQLILYGGYTGAQIQDAFTRYVWVTDWNGTVWKSGGLWRRRMDESEMFNSGDYARNDRTIPSGYR